ncbi:FAD binding domain-containing protein [Plantactinospora endophytica]|uniref:FAD-binding molybdopterin dehydrogenase n=1 Tax=Plantactinospora endophytica TaxID=673535 RepID=A0ABQ4E9M9_9ACTN|nr:xanthine dehydrogenase family protein subunit M [Plantactinospora endophytica]GIG91428.1 FAD-binding molybdopterin dehydrogenase [Plantactinospora endophytica]
MNEIRYVRASTPAQAVALASAEPDTAFVAGGTELTNLMRDGVQVPGLVVDVNRVAERGIEWQPGRVRIGALARMAEVARDTGVRHRLPVVSTALLASASGQVRNMASIGGNLLQRTRCWYYRDTALPCNARVPGSGCPALAGENRWHAIFGGSESCIRVHPSDLAVALTALDATVLTQGPGGARRLPIETLHRLPGDAPHRETVLEHGELVVAVEVPATAMAARSRYRKVRDRASFEFALVSVAVALELRGRTVRDVRIALGGVAPRPWRAREAEDVLRGERLTDAAVAAAGAVAVRGAVPREHNAFKLDLVSRTLAGVLGELGGGR